MVGGNPVVRRRSGYRYGGKRLRAAAVRRAPNGISGVSRTCSPVWGALYYADSIHSLWSGAGCRSTPAREEDGLLRSVVFGLPGIGGFLLMGSDLDARRKEYTRRRIRRHGRSATGCAPEWTCRKMTCLTCNGVASKRGSTLCQCNSSLSSRRCGERSPRPRL